MNSIMVAIIAAAELSNGIPAGLLQSICTVESSGNPLAISHYDGDGTHSYGLCQVKLNTARMYNKKIVEKDLLNPTINVNIAAGYLRTNYDKYKSWNKATIAYNKGHATGDNNSYNRKVTKEWMKLIKRSSYKKDPHEIRYEGTPLFGVYKNKTTYKVYFVNPGTFRVVEGEKVTDYSNFDDAFDDVLVR